jgi:two-component system OmpR family sensor kinase/two-component system sensor histidine kinase BaeS
MRLSLFWKIMAAFALVLVAGVGGVTFIARQTTASEFRHYMFGAAGPDQLAAQLADYYAQNGSWNGVEAFLGGGGMMSGRGMMRGGGSAGLGGQGGPGQRIIIADVQGNVVADSTGGTSGQLPPGQLSRGVPIITVKGQRVGTLLYTSGGGMMFGMMDTPEQNFLDRVNRAVLAAGLVAGVVALILGFVVFRGITAPLNRLTCAAHAVAEGDLSQRVNIHTGDEIAELGAAFNSMAVNLERSEQVRRQMTADIAHELRTPLSVIQGNLEAVLDGVYPADAEHIQPALDQAQLLARLVEDLRTLALAEAGQLSLDRQPAEATELVKRVVTSFEPKAADKRVTLSIDAPTSLPRVRADGQRIAQVLTNLLSNALRYTPQDGRVDVRLRPEAQSVLISVNDTGPGISAEDLPHIFDRFYRADKSRSRDAPGAGGSGLGLAIARSIVEAHGGRIWAESETGKGTTITFTLPVE